MWLCPCFPMEEMNPVSQGMVPESPGSSLLDWALFLCSLLFKSVRHDPPVVVTRPGSTFLFLQITSMPLAQATRQHEAGGWSCVGSLRADRAEVCRTGALRTAPREGCSSNCGLIAQALALRPRHRPGLGRRPHPKAAGDCSGLHVLIKLS